MTGQIKGTLDTTLEALVAGLEGIIEWRWDGRFNTALGELSASDKTRVLEILEQHLVSSWDSSSVREAPDVVQDIVKSLGGLMSGQLLLLSDSRQAACIFCAWWPWGSGARISIRIAPFSVALSSDDTVAMTESFRRIFKI